MEDVRQPALRAPTITLDDFIEQRGLDRVDFVNMDVEGSELRVLQGGSRSLQRLRPKLAIAAYHHDDDLVRILDALSALEVPYRLYLDTFSALEVETVLFGASS